MDSLFRVEGESGKGREGVCHCGLTSSTAPEGLTDSTAKYNVLETWTMTAIHLNYHHRNPLIQPHSHKFGTFLNKIIFYHFICNYYLAAKCTIVTWFWGTKYCCCTILTCTRNDFVQKCTVQQAKQNIQQVLLDKHGQKDRQACVSLWHKSSSVGLRSPSHVIPSARHELPHSSFLSMPPGPRLILTIFPVFLRLSLCLLCSVSLSSVFSCSSSY